MDIHRSRFVPYPSSAINALAFSHSSNSRNDDAAVRLAVGRANGDIETWNPHNGAWVQEVTFRGGKDRSVEGLTWIQEPDDVDHDGNTIPGQLRLFSIGYSSSVTEWNLATGLPLRHSGGNSSEVWCMAAQPRWQTEKPGSQTNGEVWRGQNIVAGCADGTVALLSTADGDLQFQRYLTRGTQKRARCLSVAWQSRDIVVAGFADSSIRVYDARNGTLVRTISLGAGPTKGPREILVWSLKCLPNGDIVSGDSTGDIRFFDGKYYSQTQRLSGHETDVLAVAVSHDGQTVFSTGPDRRLAIYRLGTSTEGSKRRWWTKSSHQRHHCHDVKGLATYESANMSVLASGGVDTNLIIHPIKGHGEEYSRTISGLPQHQHVVSSRNRLLASWWEREVWIWQIQRSSRSTEPHKLLSKVSLKGEANINSVSISADGSILAVATAAEVRLFNLKIKGVQPVQTLRIRKIDSPKTLQGRGARLVQLSRDSKWLAVARQDSEVQLYRITENDTIPSGYQVVPTAQDLSRLHRRPSGSTPYSALGRYDRTITRLQFSGDSHVLVASDLAGYIDNWLLTGHEDTTAAEADIVDQASSAGSDEESDDEDGRKVVLYGQYWARNPSAHLLPKLDASPLILTFRPSKTIDQPEPNGNPAVHATRHNPHPLPHEVPRGPYHLVIVTAQHHIFEFDLLSGHMTKWSRRNPASYLPSAFSSIRDRVVGAAWHVSSKWERLWLYGSNWVYMFDLSQDFAPNSGSGLVNGDGEIHKKRRREVEAEQSQKGTSGAGSKRKASDYDGLGKRVRRIDGSSMSGTSGYSEFDGAHSSGNTDDDEDMFDRRRALDESNDEQYPDGTPGEVRKLTSQSWHTFKYRPILGIAPLSDEIDAEDENEDAALEVVLIERPSWDLDLPPRFMGVHERE